jgi:predicted nuclease of predicted toxin-antitoxin system
MSLAFFFDECADEDVARALASQGVDVLTTTASGRKGLSDEEQLLFARQLGRVVYTTDDDFLRLAIAYQQRAEPFAGIIYHQPQARTKRQIIDALLLCHACYEAADMADRIEYL